MATPGDRAATYVGGGAGGKFQKRPIRRSAQTTPYDRPTTALRNNTPSLFAKLVDPASRLIYAGANRLFGVFQKRLPSIPSQRPPETNEELRNGIQEAGPNDCTGVSEPSTDLGGNLASISAATEISELEHVLKQKTFTRSEIERLSALLHSRTNESPSDDVVEMDGSKLPNTTSHLLRLEASTSGPVTKHVESENFHAAISTPMVNSRVLEEDVASPAELAKAYMGTRPAKVSPSTLRLGSQALRQDSVLLNNTAVLPKTPITSLAPKTAGSFRGLENGYTTPRSRGRSAIYNMARSPYYRGPSTFSQKGIKSDYGHGLASPSLEHEESFGSSKMALKRRSSVLDDDIGSGGPLSRIRQKAYLPSQGSSLSKYRRESGSSAYEQPSAASQKLLLRNEPEPKVSKAVEENRETSMRSSSYYASVPTKSTQMASKILEQLERLSPKEKPSGSRLAGTSEKSPTTLTSNMIHGQALRSVEKVDSPKFLPIPQVNQKSESQHESTSQSKEKVEENGPRKFAIPRNVLSSVNGNSTVPVRDNALIVTNTDSTLKMPAEPPQKKRAFQMSAHEDYLELDDGNHSNGHVSIPLGENKKHNDVSAETPAKVIQTPAMSEVRKTSPPEVGKIPEMPSFKKPDNATISPPKTDFGPPGGSVLNEQKIGFNFTSSPPSSTDTQSVAPQKEPKAFPTFGTSNKNDEKVPPFLFSASEPSGFKPNASPDAKSLGSSSLFNSVTKNDQAQFSASNKDDNGNGNSQKPINIFGKSESLPSNGPTTSTTTSLFSFGVSGSDSTKTSSITNSTPASNPPLFSNNTNKLFNTTSPTTFTPTPVFSFGSAKASPVSSPMAESPETNTTKHKEPPKSNTTSSLFGFNSPATTSTTSNPSQGSFFSGSQATPFGSSAPTFSFGLNSSAALSETQASGSTGNVFGSALNITPGFGLSSSAASSETKPGGSTVNVFGSALNPTPSFGLTSVVASSEAKTGGSTTSVFGSTTFGSSSTPFSFGASSSTSTSSPIVFGSSASTRSSTFSFTAFGNSTPIFGGATASPNNNDQMSMEDSMADDSSMQMANPGFGQAPAGAPGFMFGSGTQKAQTVPFPFGGPVNSPNPFQATGSVELNGGGSFSLGAGGGDKTGRRILRANRNKNRVKRS